MENLYILVFEAEPPIKIGLSGNLPQRVRELGTARFNLQSSYRVVAQSARPVTRLEHALIEKPKQSEFFGLRVV